MALGTVNRGHRLFQHQGLFFFFLKRNKLLKGRSLPERQLTHKQWTWRKSKILIRSSRIEELAVATWEQAQQLSISTDREGRGLHVEGACSAGYQP